MAPAPTRPATLLWSLPALAALLSLLWYRRRRSLQPPPASACEVVGQHPAAAAAPASATTAQERTQLPPLIVPVVRCWASDHAAADQPKQASDITGPGAKSTLGLLLSEDAKEKKQGYVAEKEMVNTDEQDSHKGDLDVRDRKEGEGAVDEKRNGTDGTTQKDTESKKYVQYEGSQSSDQKNRAAEVTSENTCRENCLQGITDECVPSQTVVKEVEQCGGSSTEEESSLSVLLGSKHLEQGPLCPSPVMEVAGNDDSVNSPADAMLASPHCCYSDAPSEESSDSGKGRSDVATPPANEALVYEFVLPQHLVGRLIGRHGAFVQHIKARTNASVLIKRHPETARLKVCAVEGAPLDVEAALVLVRAKFPEKRYPAVSLQQVHFVAPTVPPMLPLLPDCLRLQLVEGISNDVIMSSAVSPAHFFLQQPTHPTFPALSRLCSCMDATYTAADTPPVPAVQAGIVVAAPVMGSWYRAEVVAVEEEASTCQVRYVDFGGYDVQDNSALRQIRSDFMTLPFQAAECYLANVCPMGEAGWSEEALAVVEQLTAGQVLQAQVCGYSEDGLPAVCLFAAFRQQVVPIGRELVARGLALWWEPADGSTGL